MKLTVLMPGSGFPKLRSAVTLVESRGLKILVDSGLAEDADRLLAALALQGVEAAEIDWVVSTHLHYDHCGNHLLFPESRFLVNRADLAATQEFMRCFHSDETPGKRRTAELLRQTNEQVKPFYIRSIVREVTRNQAFYDAVLRGDERFKAVDGPVVVTDEVSIIETPGHTKGHMSVVARGVESILPGGGTVDVLVAGDAVFSPPTSAAGSGQHEVGLAADTSLYLRTRQRLLDEFRFVVPGHGGLIDQDSPYEAPPAISEQALGRAAASRGRAEIGLEAS